MEGNGPDVSEVQQQVDGGQHVDTQTRTDVPDQDEILERDERIAEAKRLRKEVLDFLETVPEYQKEVMRWVREASGDEKSRVISLQSGTRPMDVTIRNHDQNLQYDELSIRFFPSDAEIGEDGYVGNPEEGFGFRISVPENNPLIPTQIFLNGHLEPGEKTTPPDNSRRAVAKIEKHIEGIKTGFAESATPSVPEEPIA
jgi:hypothetical protein